MNYELSVIAGLTRNPLIIKIMNYKKIFPVILFLLSINFFALQAQNSRTTQTIVADVLAQMPTKNQADYNKQIGDLASTGEEGILILSRMLKAPGQGSNAQVEYALSGLANYVSGLKNEQAKQTTVNAFQKAIATTNVPEIRTFFQSQLIILGVGYQPAAIAEEILPTLTKNSPVHLRIAALQEEIQKSAGNEKEVAKKVLTALKDPSAEYRNAALNFASPFAGNEIYLELAKAVQKAKPNVQVDILNWFGRESKLSGKNNLIKNLEIKYNLTFNQVLTKLFNEKNPEVKEAAAWTMVKIGDTSAIPLLSSLLTKSDSRTIQLGKETLMSFKGDLSSAVAGVINNASEEGKIAAVEILASRKATSQINKILELTKSSSPKVKNVAYSALKDVADAKDFTRLCGMLESADAEAVKPLQQAVIASISSLPQKEQVSTVSGRMLQAGESMRYLYYTVLASTGDKEALPEIIKGFKQDDTKKKEAAFDALLTWKGNEAAGQLFDIASDKSEQTAYANRALSRYVELVSNPAITPENRLLGLRKAMEVSRTDEQRKTILQQIGRTGTFLAMIYAGEFLDNRAVQQTAANAVMNIALENKNYTGKNVRELLNKVSAVLDNPDAGYQRESIRKHLEDMPVEEGFVSIFNGKDLTGWKGLVENPVVRAKMTPAQLATAQVKADEQMRKDWKVENGYLVFDGAGYDNLCTIKQYGDIEMYIDWMLDPSGKEADAGIYLRGTPQVQIWDTARVNVGAQVGSGGLYNNRTNPSKPLKVADNFMGEWNTFYIKMVGDRVTIYLNGELVTDNIILENYWARRQAIFPTEQLELQAHGSKVYYRNIYVKELKRPEPFTLSPEEQKEGFKALFDGTNMFEWTGNTVDYTLKDGTITLVPSMGSGGNLYTKSEYDNFVFRFDFMLTPGANNGLGIRTPMEGDAAYVGMELQILDNEDPIYKDLEIWQYHGSVYGIIHAKRGFLKPLGEWNTQEVIANGDKIKITLNGEVILDGNLREATKNGTIDGKEHPGLFNKKGHIGFLGHGSEVKFRNIRIKELK